MTRPLLPLPREGARVRLQAGTGPTVNVVRLADEVVVGSAHISVSRGSLTIERLCIEEPFRGYGCGSEAVRLLLEAASGRYRRVRAWAPPGLGLAVYFWSRMGLRPLFGDGPEGGIWFERDLGRPGAA
ncbi:MAG: GNAT family N-acetyltransferase [Tepidiformaceae bacterium]